ncbi:MAG: HDIG domain-containing protein [Acidobacteriota bacterium]|jgi:putative nucleotidyltransferase with HDIG domain|nr:HDIG domain-containing protein [Acidobacteriota bacterium]
MAASGGFERWVERPRQQWHLELLRNLRSGLGWWDLLIGFAATLGIALVLIGFRHQSIPRYEAGQFADRDVRAFQDVTYKDVAATALKQAEAQASVPAVYQIETELIDGKVQSLTSAFAEARDLLAASEAVSDSGEKKADRDRLLEELHKKLGRVFPRDTLEVLLRYNFSPALESSLVRLLDGILRDGVIGDRGELLKDLRTGVVVRDGAMQMERPLSDAWLKPDVSAAKELLRKTPLNFRGLSAREQTTLVQFLESQLVPTLVCDREETGERRREASENIRPVEVRIKQGQIIVRAEEQVTDKVQQQLDALRTLREPRSLLGQALGYFILAVILVYSLWRYFFYYQQHEKRIRSRTVLILCVLVFELFVMRLGTALADILNERFQDALDPSMLYCGIPFAFGAVLVTLLVDINLGVVASIMLAVITGLFYGSADLGAYCMIGCIAGIYGIRQYKDRAAILKSGLTVGAANLLTLAAIGLLRQSSVDFSGVLAFFALAMLSGVVGSALASMLLPALEAIFRATTDVRLLELSNLNAPVLRRLAVDAPGTYHHSLMLATLAEAAAEAIDANPLLVRVGAYYHDIGKLEKPDYFVENQSRGGNRHEELSPNMSCLVIASHVKDGLHFAKMAGLPPRISDMIPQHHGTRIMTFFYKKALDAAGGDKSKVVEADFRYPGPRPQSREAAILMMADSIEAASRTMGEAPAPAQIEGMVDRVVDAIVADGQLDECDITMRDIASVKASFFKILAGSFHHRIEYPGYDFKNRKEDAPGGDHPGAEPPKARRD